MFRDNRFNSKEYTYIAGRTVADIVDELSINPDEIGILMINSKHCQLSDQPNVGDKLAIFPVVGGG